MSWDAELDGHSWNYTHNTSRMIYDVLNRTQWPGLVAGTSWWALLDGMDRDTGAGYLETIIKGLEADPAKYRAMNPENGWGTYDGLLTVLREMLAASRSPESRWWASG